VSGQEIDQAEVDRRFALVRGRYGHQIGPTAFGDVRRRIEGIVAGGKRLKAVRLENSVEPFSVFVPYRKERGDD
jgi:hypothetical protein